MEPKKTNNHSSKKVRDNNFLRFLKIVNVIIAIAFLIGVVIFWVYNSSTTNERLEWAYLRMDMRSIQDSFATNGGEWKYSEEFNGGGLSKATNKISLDATITSHDSQRQVLQTYIDLIPFDRSTYYGKPIFEVSTVNSEKTQDKTIINTKINWGYDKNINCYIDSYNGTGSDTHNIHLSCSGQTDASVRPYWD